MKLTLCTGAALVAVFTPAAYAADGGGVSVTPSSPAPGADVGLRVGGCAGQSGTAASEAFVADARLVGIDGTLVGESRVRSSLAEGTYDVKVTCGDTQVKGTITVGQASSASPYAPPTTPASPVAPVHAGGGGTAHLAATAAEEAREAGPGTGHAVIGLVLAGVAAFAVVLRGARRSRGTD